MPFPIDADLGTTVEMKIGGVWTDITPYAHLSDPITVTHGRADQAARVDPGTCKITLKNLDGRFVPRNPMSPYYGKIGRNTPVRVSVRAGSPYLVGPGGTGFGTGVQTPDAAALDIVGDLDVRVDATLDNWSTSGVVPSVELAGKFNNTGSQKSWLFQARDGGLHLEWSVDGINMIQVDSTVKLPGRRRLAVAFTLDVNNGAGGSTVTFYTAGSLAGTWTQLGASVVTAGVTSIFSGTAPLRVGRASDLSFTNPEGRIWGAEIRSGINGTLVANPDFRAQTPGATTFVDGTGKTWTVQPSVSISNKRVRLAGEVSNWPVSWGNGSGMDVRVSVQGSGILRRLGQGSTPLQSTLRRRLPSMAPLGYWPMEEPAGATQAYSPIKGIRPMRVSGLTFAADDTLAGSSALPTVGAATAIRGVVNPPVAGPAPTSWQVEWVYKLTAAPASSSAMMQITGTGTITLWTLFLTGGTARILGQDGDGTTVVDALFTAGSDLYDGRWNRWLFYASVSGGTVSWTTTWINVGGGGGSGGGTYAGTLGRITAVGSPPQFPSTLSGMAIGHIAVYSPSVLYAYNNADTGFNGETSGVRLSRLATEEALPLTIYGDINSQSRMGPQRPAPILDLLSDAAEADGGILYERRNALGLAYRDLNGLYNQPVTLALDYTAKGHVAPPLQPVDDDQGIHNDVTVTRVNGSSARVTLDTGALSTQAPPNGVGPYAGNPVTLNLHDDDQPEQQAGWRLLLGTWDEARYPSVHVNLAKAPGLIDAATELDSGDLISIANLPSFLPPDDLLLMAQGYTEIIGLRAWDITFNCTPGGPWSSIGVADDPGSRTDTGGSQLAADLTSTAAQVAVSTTSGPTWTPDPTDTPFNIEAGGEVMTVTTVGQVLNANPFFDTDVIGWTPSGCTIVRSTARVYPDGVASALITPDGVTAAGGIASTIRSTVGSITAGSSYTIVAWVYANAAYADLRTAVDWYDINNVYLSTGGITITSAVPAGAWTLLTQTIVAPASASRAAMRVRHAGTPAASATYYVWGARLIPVASYDVTSPVALNANPGFEIDTSSWGATNATIARSTAQAKFGSASLLLTVTNATNPRTEAFQVPVSPGQQYRAMGWLYAPVAMAGGASVSINWFDAGHNYVSTSSASSVPGVAVWEQRNTLFTAPANAEWASVFFQPNGTPAVGAQLYGDDVKIVPAAPTQVFTVTRSANKVIKAHSEGEDVSLASPRFAAL